MQLTHQQVKQLVSIDDNGIMYRTSNGKPFGNPKQLSKSKVALIGYLQNNQYTVYRLAWFYWYGIMPQSNHIVWQIDGNIYNFSKDNLAIAPLRAYHSQAGKSINIEPYKITQKMVRADFECDDSGLVYKHGPKKGKRAGSKAVYSPGFKYVMCQYRGHTYPLTRLVWLYHYGVIPLPDVCQVINIDGDKYNCHISNLQLADNDVYNKTKRKCSTYAGRPPTSQYKGVYYVTSRGQWAAKCRVDGKTTWGGYHDSEQEAALTYNKLAKQLHGQYACLNDVG